MNLLSTINTVIVWMTLAGTTTAAESCISSLTASYQTPLVGDGWSAKLIAQGLSSPRSILFDSNGGLLVVQQSKGIVHLQFDDGGGTCLTLANTTYLINSTSVSFIGESLPPGRNSSPVL